MPTEVRVELGDFLDRFALATLHDDVRAFCGRSGAALATSEADRTGNFVAQRARNVSVP